MRREVMTVIGVVLALALPMLEAAADELATVLHVPPGAWTAGESQRLNAEVLNDWQLDEVYVGVRRQGSSEPYEQLALQRATQDYFIAIVPARMVQPPGLEYYIASQSDGGDVRYHFASATAPHSLVVHGDTPEVRVADRLARHRGHRNELRLGGELTRYGRRIVDVPLEDGSTYQGPTDVGSDQWWRVRIDYTYRLLGVLYEIHFRIGLLRAQWPTVTMDGGGTSRVDVAADRPDPGLNYGRGGITLEAHRFVSFDLDLILGASHEGFVGGFAALARIGRIAGTRFELEAVVIQDLGATGRFRFAWDTVRRFPMALTVEIDNRPGGSDSPLGSRLLFDLGFEATDRLTITGRGGYAARSNGRESGWVIGLATGYEF